MQRIGLPAVVDTPRNWKLDFKVIERAGRVALEQEARAQIEQACEYFHYLSHQPTRMDLYTELTELAEQARLAKEGPGYWRKCLALLGQVSPTADLALDEAGVNAETIADRFQRTRIHPKPLERFFRNVAAKYGTSSRGRQTNWEFLNLVRSLAEVYTAAGGSAKVSKWKSGKRSGWFVGFVFEIVHQVRPALKGARSSLLHPKRDYDTDKQAVGRAVDHALGKLKEIEKLPGKQLSAGLGQK